jgi:hypothetical protein
LLDLLCFEPICALPRLEPLCGKLRRVLTLAHTFLARDPQNQAGTLALTG